MLSNRLAIDTQGLRKEFGRKVAVADLTLSVERGEVFGFLGPNGAGKTTSIKMLLGLTSPTAGKAALLGMSLGDRAVRAKIGFLPEHFRFHEWLRAGEFLHLHGRLFGMSQHERDQTVPELLELVGLGDQMHLKLKAFSKGMLQRIGLAQALLNNPALVFLDEPTSGLDPIGRRMVRDVISLLRQKGTTIFLNSHLLSEVEQTCDRVAFIRDGKIIQSCSLDQYESGRIGVTLRVGKSDDALLAGLRRFDSAVSLAKANGRFQLVLKSPESVPELASWVVSQGYTLYELTPQKLSLEDQFLEVVGRDANSQ